jgi:2-polyprenyl-6-methoxyphenol hydroxylase-like FAD-dependent oxidoreductase
MTSVVHPEPPAVVLGGGVAGLATAKLLARHHQSVLVLERDVRMRGTPEDAFRYWERGGVPQFRHSHAFLARLRLSLLGHLPDVLARLRGIGVREIPLADMVPPGMRFRPHPDDEDVVLLACRRATFEWALRESTFAEPRVEVREGTSVSGLLGHSVGGKRPQVTGVRLEDGTRVPASIVVDTLGRRSPVPAWLTALGGPAPAERVSDSGIFYLTRFYRFRPGKAPKHPSGLIASDLGWVKIAIFPGDADTFSITIGTPVDDRALKRLADAKHFERFLQAFPSIAPWRQRGVSVPIDGESTPVRVMGQLRNRRRVYVDREGPLAPGLFVVGDAAYHSNPIYGRGCPSALMQATFLDEAMARHARDPIAAARRLHDLNERYVRPFFDAAVASDHRMLGHRRRAALTDPTAFLVSAAEQAFGWFLERGVLPATRVDPVVFRGLLRVFHMLDAPERLMRDPELLLRALPILARTLSGDEPEERFVRVSRAEVLRRLDDEGRAA